MCALLARRSASAVLQSGGLMQAGSRRPFGIVRLGCTVGAPARMAASPGNVWTVLRWRGEGHDNPDVMTGKHTDLKSTPGSGGLNAAE